MSDFNRWNTAAPGQVRETVAVDAGLRAYMLRVYNYMAMAVALTGVVAWFTFQAAVTTDASGAIVGLTSFGQMIFSGVGDDRAGAGDARAGVLHQLPHPEPCNTRRP